MKNKNMVFGAGSATEDGRGILIILTKQRTKYKLVLELESRNCKKKDSLCIKNLSKEDMGLLSDIGMSLHQEIEENVFKDFKHNCCIKKVE